MPLDTIHLSVLFELLFAIPALYVRRRRDANGRIEPPELDRVLIVLLAVTVATMCKIAFLGSRGLSFFGVLHVVYLDLVVVGPAVGLFAILDASYRRLRHGLRSRRLASRLAAWCLLACAGVGVYASWIEPYRLQIETANVRLQPERAGNGAVSIAVLADLQTDHITGYEQEAVRRLVALEPDLILIPGDLFQASDEEFERELPALRALAAGLTAPFGVYFVLGNTDASRRSLERVFDGTAVQMLENDVAEISVRERRISILGLYSLWSHPKCLAALKAFESRPEDGAIRIVLSHYPDPVFALEPGTRVDLLVAGHTHGGQVQLPLLGPPIVLSQVPRSVGAGGLHTLDGRSLYISRGVGMEREQAPRIRFLCPPEISLLELDG